MSVDDTLKDMSRVSLMSTSGERFQSILLDYDNRNAYEKNQDDEYLKEYYTSLVEIRSDISGIYMFDFNKLIFYHDSMNPSVRKNVDAYVVLEDIRKKSEKFKRSNCYLAVDHQPRFMRYTQNYERNPFTQNCIWLLRDIYSFSPHKKMGSVGLTVQVETIKDILDESIGVDMFYILLTQSGEIICCQDGNLIGRMIAEISPGIAKTLRTEGSKEAEWDGQMNKTMNVQSDYSNLILVTGKSINHFAEEATGFIWYSIVIGLFVALFIVIVTFRNVSVILKPLKLLANEMSNFNGNSLKVRYPVTPNYEIGQLVKAFNSMVNMLDELIEKQYIDKVKIKESQLNEQKLSMLYLKSQVNPHFLYNTLDTIKIRAEINDDKEVSHMLMELVKFFRLNVKVDKQFVTLDHEFNLIDSYLKLMNYRYEKITYQYDIDDTLMNILVPNFILQPIVENSLLHGLRNKGYQGNLYLSAHRMKEAGKIEIIIKDNGVGFDRETKEQVNKMLREYDNNENRNLDKWNRIGIMNVQIRLKMFYKDNGGLYYTDNEDGGVAAHIVIEEKYKF